MTSGGQSCQDLNHQDENWYQTLPDYTFAIKHIENLL